MTLVKKTEEYKPLPKAQAKGSRIEFDAVRLFATFSVIAVHVGTPVVNGFGEIESQHWWAGNFYESLFRSGIPLFLMLTGALLLPRAKGFAFVKNRELRVLLPLCFWTLAYLIAKNPVSEFEIMDFVQALYNGASYHFWYVYMIMCVYIMMPVLREIIQKIYPSTTAVFLIICCTALFIKPFSIKLTNISNSIDYIIYIEYIVFGYCLATNSNPWWLNNTTVGLVFIGAGFVITFLGTYYLSTSIGAQNAYLYQSTTAHIFLKAVGLWIVLKNLTAYAPYKVATFLRASSKLSFGVFLIHPLVIDHILIVRLSISHNFIHPIIGIGLSSLSCFAVGMLIIYLLSKLPFGKYTY